MDHVQANGSLLAKFTAPNGGSETVAYFHQDHLGFTRLETDAAGKVVARMDYKPFGATMPGITPDEPYAFTGQRNDGATGLYYYGARFYDPAVGRFITADSWTNLPDDERGYIVGMNPGGYNRYVYVLNNPLRFNDPTGHKWDVGGDGRWAADANDPDDPEH